MFSSTEGAQKYVNGRKTSNKRKNINPSSFGFAKIYLLFKGDYPELLHYLFVYASATLSTVKSPRPRSGALFYSAAVLISQSIFNNCCCLIDETYAENVFVEEGSVETVYNVVHTEVSCLEEIVNVFIESVD